MYSALKKLSTFRLSKTLKVFIVKFLRFPLPTEPKIKVVRAMKNSRTVTPRTNCAHMSHTPIAT